jgi:hypothetical protein
MELSCGGLIFDRHEPPPTRRSMVYFCTGVLTTVRNIEVALKIAR